ncbi:MAG: hypothetical protein WCF26_04115 [Candidatus Sulfotelmatobacter sp.]
MLVRLLVIAVLLNFGLTGTQIDDPSDDSVGKTPAQPNNSTPKSNPEIERLLRALGGTWSITDELAPDASSPKGKKGVGTIIWRPRPGEFSAVEEFRSNYGDVEVTGIGMLWWEAALHGYHVIWCDSTNPGGCINFKNAARWEGSSLILQEDYEVHGKKYTFKEIFGDITSDSFTQTLYGSEAGASLKVDEIIHGRRRKG